MAITKESLSESEKAALRWIKTTSCNLVSHIPDKTERNVFGDPVPGMSIFRKLEKKGLCFETIEDPVRFTDDPNEEPFYFTPSMELTDEGQAIADELAR